MRSRYSVLIEYIRNFNISDLYFIFRQKHKDQAERTVKVLKLVFVLDNAFKMKSRLSIINKTKYARG